MSWFEDLLSGNKANGANSNAQEGVSQSQHAFDGLTAPQLATINAQPTSSASNLDPDAQKAQRASLAALQALASNGGANAASTAQQNAITQQEGQQAQAQRNSVMQNAAARGQANGNTALLGQLQGNQAAANTAAMQGAQLAGNNANTALGATEGAANIGAGLQGQALAAAQAKDVMARFNAGQNLAAQQYNSQLPQQQFTDSMGIAAGKAGGGRQATDYWSGNANQANQTTGGILGGILNGTGAVAGLQQKGGGTVGGNAIDAAFAADGGLVPGPQNAPGDSLLNDVVPYKGPKGPVNLSGGEVVVPKTLRANGKDHEIASFVRHPPAVKQPSPTGSKDKEAMLAALKHLGRK